MTKENSGAVQLRGAIFDMDGLMFDTERLYGLAWEATARKYGQTPDPAMHQSICGTSGESSRQAVRKHYPDVTEIDSFISDGIRWVQDYMNDSVPEKPGIHEIIEYLYEQGFRLAVASGSSHEIVVRNLKKVGLSKYFSAIVGGLDIEHGKPAPDIFLAAADKIGIPPQECYVFEDGINGMLAAIAAGCSAVMVPDVMPPTDFIKENCTAIYPSLLDALEALKSGEI